MKHHAPLTEIATEDSSGKMLHLSTTYQREIHRMNDVFYKN